MDTEKHRDDYTENQNRHDFGPSEPYGRDSDFDAENENESEEPKENPTGPLDALLGNDADDSLTHDEPHDADPDQTTSGQQRTGGELE